MASLKKHHNQNIQQTNHSVYILLNSYFFLVSFIKDANTTYCFLCNLLLI